jgi:hypothetical protein
MLLVPHVCCGGDIVKHCGADKSRPLLEEVIFSMRHVLVLVTVVSMVVMLVMSVSPAFAARPLYSCINPTTPVSGPRYIRKNTERF